ncbi:MAG: DUF3795 domain-containing protein [Candidatus Thermoplasmatota archaeon]|nr:DUF3795 domain-containing protein [Candidatus Thermoplasmatota archaeon]MBS3790471.1 DUF3795 domain-containing protein [Candidatus Thermoplasmatota archaeon]
MEEEIGACGLLCHDCSIYMAHTDKNQAKKVRDWFLKEGFLTENKSIDEFMADGPYCLGCHGDKETHWSPDCWILRCCVDGKGLNNCSECSEFPCKGLEEWSTKDESYDKALKRMKGIKANL